MSVNFSISQKPKLIVQIVTKKSMKQFSVPGQHIYFIATEVVNVGMLKFQSALTIILEPFIQVIKFIVTTTMKDIV